MNKTDAAVNGLTAILATTPQGQLIQLGLGLLPEVIAAIRNPNPDLPRLLEESDMNADILINRGQEEQKRTE
jgi:hypothetical protein